MRDEQVLTVEQYLALPDDDRFIDEVSRGRVVREPRPGGEHGSIVVEVITLLRRYLEQQPVGRLVTESGFILSTSPLIIRGPDVGFIRAERQSVVHAGFIEGPPDLAVEVVSPSDRPGALLAKIAEFLEAGTEAVWAIYPATCSVVVHSANGDISIYDAAGSVPGGELLPGFELRVGDLFR